MIPPKSVPEIVAGCERFLNGHGRRSVWEYALAVAESPLAELRSDHYGAGGFVTEFEREIAELLGMESAVFMPSGTMAQQIALRIWADERGSRRVAFHPTCHLELWEKHAYRELHHLESVLIGSVDRLVTLEEIPSEEATVAALLLELPQREIGGQLPTWEDLTGQCDAARSRGMRLHLDGARLWECQPYYARPLREIAGLFDSLYVSFYKTIGALPGAMLAGPASFIDEARVWLRRHGGNLQQQAIAAISAKINLDLRMPRIPAYIAKAAEVAAALRRFPQVRIVPEFPPTNMMHAYLEGDPEALVASALRIADETKVGLFFGLGPTGKLEFSIGDSALEIPTSEIGELFGRLLNQD